MDLIDRARDSAYDLLNELEESQDIRREIDRYIFALDKLEKNVKKRIMKEKKGK